MINHRSFFLPPPSLCRLPIESQIVVLLIAFFLLDQHYTIQSSRAEVIAAPQTLPIDSEVHTEIQPNQTIYHIQGGSVAEANLFHSLQEFSLNAQETAIFEPPPNIERIITRIVGSQRSFLDGTIQRLGNAPVDLYLLNPNGIIWGENAVLDLNGAFVGSSADRLLFENGGLFEVTPTSNSLLNISVPIGLQFGQNNPPLTIAPGGNLSLINANFESASGKIFHLIGQDITLENTQFSLPQSDFNVHSFGNLKLVGINNTNFPGTFGRSAFNQLILHADRNLEVRDSSLIVGEVFRLESHENLSLSNVYFDTGFAQLANNLNRVADIQLSAQGSIWLNRTPEGENLDRGAVLLITSTLSNANSGGVFLQSQENIETFRTTIASSSSNQGDSGSITLEAKGNILFDGGSFIAADSFINQNAGTIALKAGDRITLDRISALSSNNFGGGLSSEIRVEAGGDILFDRNSLLTSNTTERGDAGRISVQSQRGNITLRQGATIAASTFSVGKAGNVDLKAGNSIQLEDGYIYSLTSNQGDGGQITLEANNQIQFNEGSTVTTAASFLATGKGGDIQVTAGEAIVLEGQDRFLPGFSPLIASSPIYLEQEAIGVNLNAPLRGSDSPIPYAEDINNFFFSANNPSDYLTVFEPDSFPFVSIQGNLSPRDTQDYYRLEIKEPGTKMVFDVDQTQNGLNATLVISNETNLTLGSNRDVISDRLDPGSETFRDPALAFIFPSAGTYFVAIRVTGNAAPLTTPANYTLNVSRIAPSSVNTRLSTQTETNSPAGNLSLGSPLVSLTNAARLEVNSTGSGVGGNIQIQGDRLRLQNQALITAETASNQGGNISLDLGQWLLLQGQSRISTTAGTAQQGGNGGDITIEVPFVIALPGLPDPNVPNQILANAFAGQGGNIQIRTQSILGNPFLDISASSRLGVDGVVNIESPAIDLGGGLIVLTDQVLDISEQIAPACRTAALISNRLVILNRSSLQTDPRQLLSNSALIQDLRFTPDSLTSIPQVSPDRSFSHSPETDSNRMEKEANQWIRDPQGTIALISTQTNCSHLQRRSGKSF